MSRQQEYIWSCDWGSSNFRLRLVNCGTLEVRTEERAQAGVSSLVASAETRAEREILFADYLKQAVTRLTERVSSDLHLPPQTPIMISGMATSAHGWCELPYAEVPAVLEPAALKTGTIRIPGNPICFISGMRTGTDVMRGEETELIGLTQWEQWAGSIGSGLTAVILPGTHSKHVYLENGKILDFHTHMTGELFGLLGTQSVLRHSLQGETDWDEEGVRAGVEAARKFPLSRALFMVRTGTLLRNERPSFSRGFLNGLLLADELRDLVEDPQVNTITVCAGTKVAALYQAAMRALHSGPHWVFVPPNIVDSLTPMGHVAIHRSFPDTES